MIFHRKKSSIYTGLIVGISLGILITAAIFEEGKFPLYYIIYFFLSFYNIGQAIYNWTTPIVQIDKDSITFFTFPFKKQSYNLTDIHVEYKVGDYQFKTSDSKTYTIVKSSILKSQLEEFESLIKDIQEKESLNSKDLVTS